MAKPTTIDAYIANFSEPIQSFLAEMRATIKIAAPDAEETISYGMPAFKLNGVSVWFAAYKKHIGLYPVYGMETLQEDMAIYRGKGTKDSLHFGYDAPLPVALIEKVVRYKLVEKQELQVKRDPSV
jgi:uncharacterized protein YdhG (YjbR/CyaY superfamily)